LLGKSVKFSDQDNSLTKIEPILKIGFISALSLTTFQPIFVGRIVANLKSDREGAACIKNAPRTEKFSKIACLHRERQHS